MNMAYFRHGQLLTPKINQNVFTEHEPYGNSYLGETYPTLYKQSGGKGKRPFCVRSVEGGEVHFKVERFLGRLFKKQNHGGNDGVAFAAGRRSEFGRGD